MVPFESSDVFAEADACSVENPHFGLTNQHSRQQDAQQQQGRRLAEGEADETERSEEEALLLAQYDTAGVVITVLGPDGLPLRLYDEDGNEVEQFDAEGLPITTFRCVLPRSGAVAYRSRRECAAAVASVTALVWIVAWL